MFLNSIFSGIKRGSSILGLATTVTSGTTGAVTSYYLFKGSDNKEQIQKLNSKLEENKKVFLVEKREIERQGFEERMKLAREELTLKQITDCLKGEMEKHDKNWGVFWSNHTPDFKKCDQVMVRE